MEIKNISLADARKRISGAWRWIRCRFIENDKIGKTYLCIWLACFLVLLIWGIVFKCNFNHLLMIEERRSMPLDERLTFKLIPVWSIKALIDNGWYVGIAAYFLNFIALIPLGFLLGFIMNEKRAMLLTLSFILCVEIFQLFSYFGVFDLADILLNALGSFVGYRLCRALSHLLTPRKINTVGLFLTVPLVLLTIFAIVRTIILFPV